MGFIPDSWMGRPLDTREKVAEWRKGYKNPSGVWVQGITTLNAVGEELLLKNKIYRQSALERRCLILSSGFFEWHHYFPAHKKTGLPLKTEATIPHYITLKEKPYFYMAGIYKPWTDVVTGEHVDTCAIVTTTAKGNRIMEWVHNSKERMPTILNEDLAYEWLFGKLSEERITEIATTQLPMEQLQACPIDKKFREALDPTQVFIYGDEVPSLEKYLAEAG
jgi:putative SOS response-associated peptidase YedK